MLLAISNTHHVLFQMHSRPTFKNIYSKFFRFCKISSYDFAYVESACMSQNQKLKFDDIQGIYISFINHTYIVKLILSIASGEFLEVIYRWSYRKSALSELCICL